MNHLDYKDQKKNFDNKVALYFINRAFTPNENSDAYSEGIIDGVGSVVKQPTGTNNWAFTVFDRIMLSLKQKMGEESLQNLLGEFSWLKDVDPLYLMNCPTTPDFKPLKTAWDKIITKVESKKYLPSGVQRNDNFLEEGDDDKTYRNRLSFSVTLATLLLHCLLNKKMVDFSDFTHNVVPSVECTWWITPYTNYDELQSYVKENNLLDSYNNVTNEGIKLLTDIAHDAIEGKSLNSKIERIENKYDTWEKLAKIGSK